MLFSKFFDTWLYGEDGYYNTFKAIGKEGDFFTAVSATNFFGASIANYLYKQIQNEDLSPQVTLLEIGAHRGYLLCDMIQWLFTCDPSLIQSMQFAIVEKQPHVQKAQKEYIYSRFGDDVEVQIYDSLEQIQKDSIFAVANEIFDAFSCELLYENKICHIDESSLHPFWVDNADTKMLAKAKKLGIEKGELAKGYEDFAKQLAATAKEIDFVSFDYGDKQPRNDFSIRIYKDHTVYPFFENGLDMQTLFKKSDITYDVNFTHLIDAFAQNGYQTLKYAPQNSALVDFGLMDILDMYAKIATQKQYMHQVNKIKTLIDPTMMGERFKMVHFKRSR
ncbi:MAG: SAM-dependent methyltransferase [Campylobacterota bacterium]